MTRPHRIRSIVRSALAAGIIVFAWYALSRVSERTADAIPLAMVSVALLLVLLAAVSRRGKRS